jgi:hypothetical protein
VMSIWTGLVRLLIVVCITVVQICWKRDVCVGDKVSRDFLPLLKSWSQSIVFAVYQSNVPLKKLHILRLGWTQHFRITGWHYQCVRQARLFCYADQTVFFPHTRKCDTVSQPVKA